MQDQKPDEKKKKPFQFSLGELIGVTLVISFILTVGVTMLRKVSEGATADKIPTLFFIMLVTPIGLVVFLNMALFLRRHFRGSNDASNARENEDFDPFEE